MWQEAYLKNGKKRVSEVREFVTKPGKIGKAEEIRVEAAGEVLCSGMMAQIVDIELTFSVCSDHYRALGRETGRGAVVWE